MFCFNEKSHKLKKKTPTEEAFMCHLLALDMCATAQDY